MVTYTHCTTTSRSLNNCLTLEYKPTEVADRSILQFHTENCQTLSIIGVLNQVMKRRIMNKKRIGTLVQVLTKKST